MPIQGQKYLFAFQYIEELKCSLFKEKKRVNPARLKIRKGNLGKS